MGKVCVVDAPPTGKSAPRAFPWLRLAGSVLALTLLLHFLPREALWTAMQRLSPGLWLLVLAGYLGTHVVGVLKWRLLLRLAGAELSFAAAARCYAAGLFGNLFLPSVVGGDVVRAGLAMRLTRKRRAVLGGSLLDRVLDAAALGSVALTGAASLHRGLDARGGALLVLVTALLTVALVLFLLRRRPSGQRHSKTGALLLGLGCGIAVQLALVALTAGIGAACGVRVPFGVWLFACSLAKLAGMVPVTQGGVGVREAALAALLVPFGVPAVSGVAVGLAWETVLIAGGLLCGLGTLVAGQRFSPPDGAGFWEREQLVIERARLR